MSGDVEITSGKELTRLLVYNAVMSRLKSLYPDADETRDVYDECHWDKNPDPFKLYNLWRRNPVAGRVVNCLPNQCWQVLPDVYDDESVEEFTPFEAEVLGLSRQLGGEESYYDDPANSVFWEYLWRVHVQSRIGQYGVLLLGVDDGRPLREPAQTFDSPRAVWSESSRRRLIYMRVYPEHLAQITEYDNSPNSPRRGHPTQYKVTTHDPDSVIGTSSTPSGTDEYVHWTRVIHVPSNLASSEVFGESAMMPVLNNLKDIEKVSGSDAEGFWKGAFMGLALQSNAPLGTRVKFDEAKLKQMMEEYEAGLERWLLLIGMEAKQLAPQVVDPTPHIMTQIDQICMRLDMPKRVFMGSERGDGFNQQDDASWNDTIRGVQNNHITPRIIAPTFNRLIRLGVLPRPMGKGKTDVPDKVAVRGYKVGWPDLESQGAHEKSDTIFKSTQALAQFVQGGVETIMSAEEFLHRFYGFSQREARTIVESARKSGMLTERAWKTSRQGSDSEDHTSGEGTTGDAGTGLEGGA